MQNIGSSFTENEGVGWNTVGYSGDHTEKGKANRKREFVGLRFTRDY